MVPVVFDLDGTLVDSLPSIRDAVNATLHDIGRPPLSGSTVAGFVGWGERVLVERVLQHLGMASSEFDSVLACFMQHYVVTSKDVVLFEGAHSALRDLSAEGYPLALCTNKPAKPTSVVMKETGLSQIMTVVVAGDDLPRRKPDPMPLRHIMTRFDADRCIYVGDSTIDAETAQNAGQHFVLYTEGIRTRAVDDIPHDVQFSDFVDLPAIIKQLSLV